MLSACSTNYAVKCEPPGHSILEAVPLPPLKSEEMPLEQLLEHWIDDMGAYNVLADRHNTLVAWVQNRC